MLKEGNCTVEAGKCVSVLKKPVICEKTGSMLKRSGEAGLLCTVWKCQVFSKSRGGEQDTMGLFEEVYEVVKKIPEGKVATYGQIAKIIKRPRSAKIVGWALHSNPYPGIVPCHRVVNRNGELSGGFAFGGKEIQRKMLENERIKFEEDGIINLKKYLWNPETDNNQNEYVDIKSHV